MSRQLLVVLVPVLVAAHASSASAGNDEGFLLGNQAALTGGAVTATVNEGSAIWYNPAGLAAVPTQSLDLSASAYGIRYFSAPEFLSASNGQTESLHVAEIIIVPTALSYVRPLSETLRFGFGLFVPHGNDVVLRGDLDAGSDGRWLVTATDYERITYGGPSLGWSVAPNVRLGASLLGFYDYSQTGLQVAGGQPSDAGSGARFITSSSVGTRHSVGAMLVAGVQWDVSPEWRVGLAVRSPSFDVYRTSAESSFGTSAVESPDGVTPSFTPSTINDTQQRFTQTTPFQVRLGLAKVWGKSWLAVDTDAQPGMRQGGEEVAVARFNVRVGGEYELAERLSLGAGLFTDRDSAPLEGTRTRPVHFYGGSAGVRWGKLYRIDDDRRRTFDFSTTLALRYAYGSGDVSSLRVASLDTAEPLSSVTSSTTIHEVMLHIGSGFYF